MCGLAFLLDAQLDPGLRRERMAAAVRALHHRGPDQAGRLDLADCSIGHTRLAIIGLAGGRQPVSDPGGRWTLAFNGEIYNYRQLRDEIGARWHFRDSSDTEVLLAGLVLEGERFIDRLDGMWGFVLHDHHAGRQMLSRDRFGKKPLYYRQWSSGFACASELPVLRVLAPELPWREDPDSIADYFRYGYAMPGHTCYLDAKEVMPGHVLVREADGSLRQTRYWNPSSEAYRGSYRDAVAETSEKLAAAVRRRQLAAEVEVGAFLSGGIDSTIICALAQGGSGQLRTYTVGFDEPSYDERAHAARAAREIGTIHHAQSLDPVQARAFAAGLPVRLGQPFGDASILPTAMVARLAAQDVKVALSGDGGDEVFGGYARYVGRLLARRYERLPDFVRRGVKVGVRAFPEPIAHHSSSLLKKAHLFLKLVDQSGERYRAPRAMGEETLTGLMPTLVGRGCPPPEMPWPQDVDEMQHMMRMDWLLYLPQDILAKVDRATMMYSLEARSPFLDRDLVEFVLKLPWQWHFRGMTGKRLLRDAMRGRVPDFVWTRRKQGFASPVGHWLKGALGDDLLELLDAGSSGVVRTEAVRGMLAGHRSGGQDHTQPLWLLYCYLKWLTMNR